MILFSFYSGETEIKMQIYSWVKWVAYVIGIILLSVIQFTTPPLLPHIYGAEPLLLIPAVIVIATFDGETTGAVSGMIAGLIWDTNSGKVFGFYTLFLLAIGIFAGLLVQYLFRNTVLSAVILTLIFTFLLEFLAWFFFYNLFGDMKILNALLKIILPATLYTTVFAFPLYYLERFFHNRLTAEK